MKLDEVNDVENQPKENKQLSDEEKAEKIRALLAKTEKPKTPEKKKSKVPKIIITIIIILIIGGLAAFIIIQYNENQYLRSPEGIAEQQQKEAETLVEKVSKIMQLPDEQPTIATVSDKEKLSEQPFFADAENGDKVLIFSQAGRAVIYRTSENRIINSGPIAITSSDIMSK